MEKKRYHTTGRSRLLAYLAENVRERPERAEEIYEGLCRAENAPGRSSVYRMLGELTESGVVRKFRGEGDAAVYQYVGANSRCAGHLHLQCLHCGRVQHLDCGCGETLSAHLLQTHGFLADCGRSVLYGTCAACAAQLSGEARSQSEPPQAQGSGAAGAGRAGGGRA